MITNFLPKSTELVTSFFLVLSVTLESTLIWHTTLCSKTVILGSFFNLITPFTIR